VKAKGTALSVHAMKEYRGADVQLSPRWYPYFDVVVGLARSHEPESYAGGSVCYW